MEDRLEYVYAKNLHTKLKERIRGKVFCKIINDELIIRIESFEYWFEMSYIDISERIIRGFGTDQICEEVLSKFRTYLIHRMEAKYFKEEIPA